ncbi:MAG TPA: MFS transporter [Planctomycetota bacterium]
MKHVWFITAVVFFYGLGNGVLLNATPQAVLHLQLSSSQLGLIGMGIPLGYALSCVLCGQLFAGVVGKRVLMAGTAIAICASLVMAQARTASACVAAQLVFGVASGAFWPFASAWLLDFQAEGISKTRLLRHYNASWTPATAFGMLLSGQLCERGWIFDAFYVGAGLLAMAFVLASIPKATQPGQSFESSPGETAGATRGERLGLAIVLAGALANLVALGARGIVINNFAELNRFIGGGAQRMGLIAAASLASQFVMFSIGGYYERWLGLRRIYFVMAGGLCVVNLGFAYATSTPLLIASAALHGAVLALAFQTGIIAAIRHFSSPRIGTTFHEAIVGLGGTAPIVAGVLVTVLRHSGAEEHAALRAPFLLFLCLTVLVLAVQLCLIATRTHQRTLLPSEGCKQAGV